VRSQTSARQRTPQAPQSQTYDTSPDVEQFIAEHGLTHCPAGKPYKIERPRSRVRYVRAVRKRLGRIRTTK
jgi:hypothetical protein